MENRMKQIVRLKNGDSYLIIKQAIYNQSNYFICGKLDNDNLTDEFELFHEIQKDGKTFLEIVYDLNTTSTIFKAFKLV